MSIKIPIPSRQIDKEIEKYECICGKPIGEFTQSDWRNISLTQPLSHTFTKIYSKWVFWPEVCISNPDINTLIFANPGKIKWQFAALNRNLTFDVAIRYVENINWDQYLLCHAGLSLDQLQQIQRLLPADKWIDQLKRISGSYPWDSGKNTEEIFEFYRDSLYWSWILQKAQQLPKKMPYIAGKVDWVAVSKSPGSLDVIERYSRNIGLDNITEYGKRGISACPMTVLQMIKYSKYLIPSYIIKKNDPNMLLDPRVIHAFRDNPNFWDTIRNEMPEKQYYCRTVVLHWVECRE